jgi:hypothetical protein
MTELTPKEIILSSKPDIGSEKKNTIKNIIASHGYTTINQIQLKNQI